MELLQEKELVKIDSKDLAYYLLIKLGDMENLKLQKLLYYIEAYHLAYFEESIIEDEFEAWVHGPVSRRIWDEIRHLELNVYGRLTISDTTEEEKNQFAKKIEKSLTSSQLSFIYDLLKEFGDKDAYYLECLSHQEDPWIEARDGLSESDKSNRIISKETMKNYYKNKIYLEE